MSATTSPAVTNAVFAALKPAQPVAPAPEVWPTPAQGRVFLPRDWPTTNEILPVLKIGVPTESKEAVGKAGIQFSTTCTLEVIGEISATAKADNAEANDVWAALGLFQRDIEMAVIGNPVLFGGAAQDADGVLPAGQPGLVEQLRSVQTKYAVNSDGEMSRGAVSVTFDFVFYQGTEDFQAPATYDVDRFHIYADLINVADPSGTYVPPMDYDPVPAPRTHGPDGRIEGEADIPLI